MKILRPVTSGSFASMVLTASAFALCAVGCAANTASDESLDGSDSAIIGGKTASGIAEAALINTDTFLCSGSVIAPRVVLTAGHCVKGARRWTVTTPFAGNQHAVSAKAWTQYVSTGEHVNAKAIDVGILVLDTPIHLPSYPTLSSEPVKDGTKATNVGRIQDGQVSSSALFSGKQVAVASGEKAGFPNSYVSRDIIESGDSGGPVYVKTAAGREIIAVNSGDGGGTQILARIDLVKSQIDRIIAESGGAN